MRDFTKSLISWTWAMSVFGALQGARILIPKAKLSAETMGAFDTVTDAATELLTAPAKMVWKAGVAAQDMVFDVIAKRAPDGSRGEEDLPGEPMPIDSLLSRY
jgi:hypothetical protein